MMDFCPGLDEALLCPREPAADALDRVERERGQGVLIQGVEVRPMVRGTDFHEHPNDYSEKARQFRHEATLHRPVPSHLANASNEPRAETTSFYEAFGASAPFVCSAAYGTKAITRLGPASCESGSLEGSTERFPGPFARGCRLRPR